VLVGLTERQQELSDGMAGKGEQAGQHQGGAAGERAILAEGGTVGGEQGQEFADERGGGRGGGGMLGHWLISVRGGIDVLLPYARSASSLLSPHCQTPKARGGRGHAPALPFAVSRALPENGETRGGGA